jgi:hypothetical protein
LPPGTYVVVRESEGGAVVALSDGLPTGLSLVVESFDTLPAATTGTGVASRYGLASNSSSGSSSVVAAGGSGLDAGSKASGVAAAAAAAAEALTKPVAEWTARLAQNLKAQQARNARNLEFRGQVRAVASQFWGQAQATLTREP